MRSTEVFPGKGKSSQTRPGNEWGGMDPTTAQTVRTLLFKSTVPSSLDPDRGVSAPQHARARAGGRGGREAEAARTACWSPGRARQGLSHLGLVAEEAKSEAAAFELHLQGGAPGHGDAAPVISGKHTGSSAPWPVPYAPSALPLCLSSASVPRRPRGGQAGNLQLPGSQTPPPETTPGPGRARHPTLPPPPKAWPVGPVRVPGEPGQTAPQTRTPYTARALRGRILPSGPGLRRLTWEWEDPKKPRPHRPHLSSLNLCARKIPWSHGSSH